MRPRQEYVLAFLVAVFFAIVNSGMEQGAYNSPPTTALAKRGSVETERSFSGATWLIADDSTAEGRKNNEELRYAITWIATRACCAIIALAVGIFILAKRFPPLPRNPPPHI
ncbi:MAG: hypothetical protein RL681_34 [Candidatus Parcubacteria bacterium]